MIRSLLEKVQSFQDLKIEVQKFLKTKYKLKNLPLYLEDDFNGKVVKYPNKKIEIQYCDDCYDKEVFSMEWK